MKHIAVRSLSLVVANRPYTVPGLGDRLHAALMGYNYSVANNTPVTLHLTDEQWSIARGVPSDTKKNSWKEILELFPPGHLFLEPHKVKPLPEKDWLAYLKNKGFDAQTYYYKDFKHPHAFPEGVGDMIEASELIHQPCLDPIVNNNIKLPNKFVTAQFDSNNVPYWKDNPSDVRKIPATVVGMIRAKWELQGYDFVFIGGDGAKELNGPGNLKILHMQCQKLNFILEQILVSFIWLQCINQKKIL